MQLTLFALFFLIAHCFAQKEPWIGQPRDASWLKHHEELLNQTIAHKSDIKIVFLGASGIQFFRTTGKEVWDKYYAPRHAYNYGIAGDQTQNVIWRIEHGEFDGVEPKIVALHIGSYT